MHHGYAREESPRYDPEAGAPVGRARVRAVRGDGDRAGRLSGGQLRQIMSAASTGLSSSPYFTIRSITGLICAGSIAVP